MINEVFLKQGNKHLQLEWLSSIACCRNRVQHCSVTSSIAIATWTTCRVWGLRTRSVLHCTVSLIKFLSVVGCFAVLILDVGLAAGLIMTLCWLDIEALCRRQRTHGSNAAAQHVVDWGPVSQESRRCSVSMSADAHVHLRICLLPAEKQSVHYIWGIVMLAVAFNSVYFFVWLVDLYRIRYSLYVWYWQSYFLYDINLFITRPFSLKDYQT